MASVTCAKDSGHWVGRQVSQRWRWVCGDGVRRQLMLEYFCCDMLTGSNAASHVAMLGTQMRPCWRWVWMTRTVSCGALSWTGATSQTRSGIAAARSAAPEL